MNRTFQRILTAGVVIPLFLVVSITPAHALLGSILAGIQRAMMISNQVTQIYKDTVAKITFDGQLTQMIGQAQHLKEQALGTVGALTDPFTELASLPTKFIGLGLSWKSSLEVTISGILGATATDTVSDLNLFRGHCVGVLAACENMGDKRLLAHDADTGLDGGEDRVWRNASPGSRKDHGIGVGHS